MRPISGSAEVSDVSCIQDLYVVIYARFLTEDTYRACISKAFSLADSCFQVYRREYPGSTGKADIRVQRILETD